MLLARGPLPPPALRPRFEYVAITNHILPDRIDFWEELIQKRPRINSDRARDFFVESKVYSLLDVTAPPGVPGKGRCTVCTSMWDGYPVDGHSANNCPIPPDYQLEFMVTNSPAVCPMCTSKENLHESCIRENDFCNDCLQRSHVIRRHIPITGLCDIEVGRELEFAMHERERHYTWVQERSQVIPWNFKSPNDRPIAAYNPNIALHGLYPYNNRQGRFQNAQYVANPYYQGLTHSYESREQERVRNLMVNLQQQYEEAYERQERLAAERVQREQERLQQERQERLDRERQEQERQARLQAERQEQERQAQLQAEREQQEMQDRQAAEELQLQRPAGPQPLVKAAERPLNMRQQIQLYELSDGVKWATAIQSAELFKYGGDSDATRAPMKLKLPKETIVKVVDNYVKPDQQRLLAQVKAHHWLGNARMCANNNAAQACRSWQVILTGSCELAKDMEHWFKVGNEHGLESLNYENFLSTLAITLAFTSDVPEVVIDPDLEEYDFSMENCDKKIYLPTSRIFNSGEEQYELPTWRNWIVALTDKLDVALGVQKKKKTGAKALAGGGKKA